MHLKHVIDPKPVLLPLYQPSHCDIRAVENELAEIDNVLSVLEEKTRTGYEPCHRILPAQKQKDLKVLAVG